MSVVAVPEVPCIIFEDDHLLVVNKPPGLNTHAPGPYAGEGIYDWLRHRESRWSNLAIIHRLDKETSGAMVLAKTPVANRSLTQQFTQRLVRKKYIFLTDRLAPQKEFEVKTTLVRAGEKYVAAPWRPGAPAAETRFRVVERANLGEMISSADANKARLGGMCTVLEAEPRTGRTHQIRVHAAEKGLPIIGDTLYRGTTAGRLYLHAAELTIEHPGTGRELTFTAPVDFKSDARLACRTALLEPGMTNAFRVLHGESDGWAGLYVDRWGDYLLAESERALSAAECDKLEHLAKIFSARGVYHKSAPRHGHPAIQAEGRQRLVLGEPAPQRFTVCENGVQFEISFNEGSSVGLFLDQRENRRRLLVKHVAADFPLFGSKNGQREILNTFAYTCAFSVCAAKAEARTTNLDLSQKYLEWGRRNFVLNQLDPDRHDFICGDVFDWLRRLAKKGRLFDLILLDPPTFSQSKVSGIFRAEKDYGKLAQAALPLLGPGGVLFASTNAAGWPPAEFVRVIENSIHAAKRPILRKHYFPQPADFPISRAEPAYLKTIWLRIGEEEGRNLLKVRSHKPALNSESSFLLS